MIKRFLLALTMLATPALADNAVVRNVKVVKVGGAYTFDVTITHTDTGWDDYADMWRVKDTSGAVLGERNLAHPHVNEQPLTRSLSGVQIPNGVTEVIIEAHDTVNGWNPEGKTVKLP
ncbi:hypothetical protein [Sulfitobacter guttiformis]|uniref:Uncharacterized protein n=1 Tax=Sulfitobacter guttiformis TaxID=74349 RepID=A0A420DRP0_9RHOB|nr:hypothetical protein [Sulfitobacter guttiformis]KIN74196.1 hypothetical protein Z949_3392 [Sulfitobacter guttiformis KCTC 32187]RKE96809.1 hypothetical protein C8N30_1379 [Sulfitobacter guttiformis]